MDNIKFVTIYSETGKLDNTISEIHIEYESGKEETIEEWYKILDFMKYVFDDYQKSGGDTSLDIKGIIEEYSKGDNPTFAVKKKTNVLEDKPIERSEEKPSDKLEDTEKPVEEPKKEEKTSKDEKKGSKKLAIGLTISGLALTGLCVALLSNHFVKLNQNGKPSGKNNRKVIEETADGKLAYNNGSKYHENLQKLVENGELNNRDYVEITRNMMSDSEFADHFREINTELAANINEICDLVSGGKMAGKEYMLHYAKMFSDGSIESLGVNYYESMRNDIVHNAYLQDESVTCSQVEAFLDEFTKFVFNGDPINVGGETIYFYDLNNQARYVILNYGMKVIEIQLASKNDYKMKYIGGATWDINVIKDETYSLFKTVAKNIKNSKTR